VFLLKVNNLIHLQDIKLILTTNISFLPKTWPIGSSTNRSITKLGLLQIKMKAYLTAEAS